MLQLAIADWTSPWKPKPRRPARATTARRRIIALAAPLPPILAYIETHKPAVRKPARWTDEQVADLEHRWFSLQSLDGVARDTGRTVSSVASKAFRLELPGRYDMPLQDRFDPARKAKFAHLFAGWRPEMCRVRKQRFWTDGCGVRYSAEARKQVRYQALMALAG